jgi:ATP-dependent RNA circularization protein (DNA/RNA ligase family)
MQENNMTDACVEKLELAILDALTDTVRRISGNENIYNDSNNTFVTPEELEAFRIRLVQRWIAAEVTKACIQPIFSKLTGE